MQNSISLGVVQAARPVGAGVGEGLEALKCAISREATRLMKTKSETFSYLCGESVSYGEVLATVAGTAALFLFMGLVGYLAGGEVM